MFVRSASAAERPARDTKKDKKRKTTFMMNVSGDSACFCVDRRRGGGQEFGDILEMTHAHTEGQQRHTCCQCLSHFCSLTNASEKMDINYSIQPVWKSVFVCVCAHTKGGSNKSLKVSPIWKVSWAKREVAAKQEEQRSEGNTD